MANTTARGYGSTHQKLRAQVKAQVDVGGVACWRCGDLIDPGEPFDLGHDDMDRSIYRGAEHRRCNRATTGRRANTSRANTSRGVPRAAIERRARQCEVCGAEYKAWGRSQRACGRACGWELRRRNAPPPPQQPTREPLMRECTECGTGFAAKGTRALTCSPACSKARSGRQSREYYHTNPEYHAATLERANQRSQAKRWKL